MAQLDLTILPRQLVTQITPRNGHVNLIIGSRHPPHLHGLLVAEAASSFTVEHFRAFNIVRRKRSTRTGHGTMMGRSWRARFGDKGDEGPAER